MKIPLGSGGFLEPDEGPRDSRFHKRIVSVTPVPDTKYSNDVVLECGHNVCIIGDLSRVEGVILCTRCRDLERKPTKVWLAQLKCPSGHCVVALAALLPEEKTDEFISGLQSLVRGLESGFDRLVAAGELNRECFICKATTLTVQVNKTAFNSMEEAMPALEASQRQQLATAEFLRQSKN